MEKKKKKGGEGVESELLRTEPGRITPRKRKGGRKTRTKGGWAGGWISRGGRCSGPWNKGAPISSKVEHGPKESTWDQRRKGRAGVHTVDKYGSITHSGQRTQLLWPIH